MERKDICKQEIIYANICPCIRYIYMLKQLALVFCHLTKVYYFRAILLVQRSSSFMDHDCRY